MWVIPLFIAQHSSPLGAEIRGQSFCSGEFRQYPEISAVYRVNPRTSADYQSIPWGSPFFLNPALHFIFELSQRLYSNSIPCLSDIPADTLSWRNQVTYFISKPAQKSVPSPFAALPPPLSLHCFLQVPPTIFPPQLSTLPLLLSSLPLAFIHLCSPP